MFRSVVKWLVIWLGLVPAMAAASALTPVEESYPAPAIDVPSLSGIRHSLSDHQGQVVVVNFWASWCPPCVKELPSMQALWERYEGRNFAMLAVNVGEDVDAVELFIETFDGLLDFYILLDNDLDVASRWKVVAMPTTFVVDASGAVVYRALGERDWTDPEIVSAIEALLDTDNSVVNTRDES
jgi:thiol-disulfide isomerase/thioredoxin